MTIPFTANGAPVAASELAPGMAVTAVIPPVRGEVLAVTNGVMTVQTTSGVLQIPVAGLPTSVAQQTVVPVKTTQGQTVAMPVAQAATLPPSQGQIVISPHVCPVPTPTGMIKIPVKTRVDVRLANGNIINVPIKAALNMERAQGATILGIAPHGGRRLAGNEANVQSALRHQDNPYVSSTSSFQTAQPLTFTGTVRNVSSGGVVLTTTRGDLLFFPAKSEFVLNGERVKVSELKSGHLVRVNVPPGRFHVKGAYQQNGETILVCEHNVTQEVSSQEVVLIPVESVPKGEHGKIRVDVRLRNGNIVNVPLNAALNMERAQGAVILGVYPHGGRRLAGNEANPNSLRNHPDNAYYGVIVGQDAQSSLVVTTMSGKSALAQIKHKDAPGLSSMKPGDPVSLGFSESGNRFAVSTWKAGHITITQMSQPATTPSRTTPGGAEGPKTLTPSGKAQGEAGGPPVMTPPGGSQGPPTMTPSGATPGGPQGPPAMTPSGATPGGPQGPPPGQSPGGGPPTMTPSGTTPGGPQGPPPGQQSPGGGPPATTPSGVTPGQPQGQPQGGPQGGGK